MQNLIGSSTAGEFTESGVTNGGVVVGLIKSDEMEFFTAIGRGISGDVLGTVQSVAEDLPNEIDGYPHLAGINLHEGLAGVGEEVAMAAHQELGRIPFTGGSAGDDMQFKNNSVFTENGIMDESRQNFLQ